MAKKLLLIEDEEIMIGLLQKKLSQEGYEVSVARDGEEGMKAMREIKPDLILLDIVMPKMGGFEVMEEMNKDPELKKIPVIVISNSGQPVELDRAQ
ncbi:MAG: PleD family two-component system response regulator, partial [Candidatus Paceibacterales bacterium]